MCEKIQVFVINFRANLRREAEMLKNWKLRAVRRCAKNVEIGVIKEKLYENLILKVLVRGFWKLIGPVCAKISTRENTLSVKNCRFEK